MSAGQLYKPFLSDSENEYDSDSDVDTDGYTKEDSLCALPGRNPPVITAVPAAIDGSDSSIKLSGTKFETAESRNTFLITINSRDRDTRAYPQPTFFTIRLPRVLRNVSKINIQQLNLLNSFFNFTVAKGNTFMFVLEQGRTRIENGVTVPNDVKISIRNGTYTADDLVVELTNALNTTPLFSGITFAEFNGIFRSTGDFSVLFNTPGPIVFNSLTQAYDRNQTIGNIVARYFQVVQNVGTISYSDQQILVGYYYPMMKELIIAQPFPVPFNTTGVEIPPGFTSWYEYIVFAFQGLSDPYVTQLLLIPENITIFTNYRNANTFNQFLVNKYTCTYNSKQGRLIISAPSLNDSISTDLNTAYNNILGTLVFENGFQSVNDFQTQYAALQNFNGSLLEFYNYVQKQFAVYFGVNFGTYADTFYENLSNEITIYNIMNRYGWNTGVNNAQINIQSNYPVTQVSTLWSNIVVDISPINEYFLSTIAVPQFAGDYLTFSNAGETTFGYTDLVFQVNPTAYVRTPFKSRCRQNISLMTIPRYINNRGPETDMIFNLSSNFTPLLYNAYSLPPGDYFIRTDLNGNLDFNMYTVQQVMFFTADYMRAFNEWLNYITPQFVAGSKIQPSNTAFGLPPTITSVSLTSFRPALFFEVNADQYPAAPGAHFNISFYVETQDGTNFPVPIQITWYKDRALFMTDAEGDLNGNPGSENPRHYFKKQVYSTDLSSAVISVDVDNLQTTYFHVNFATNANLPSSVPIRVFSLLTDAYGVYTSATLDNTYGQPWSNLPALADQFTPASAIYNSPLKSIYDSNITQLGYDISGVSNNLLDYMIRSGCNYYDPASIQDFESAARNGLRYTFIQGTNGSPQPNPSIAPPQTWSLYFANGSANTIRDLYNNINNNYLSGGVTPKPLAPGFGNDSVMINWLQPASDVKERVVLPAPTGNINTQFNQEKNLYVAAVPFASSVFLMCDNLALELPTDVKFAYINFPNTYLDISGVSAVGFYLPPNQIVKLDKMQFKFAFMQPVTNSNGVPYTRVNTSLVSSAQTFNQDIYRVQTTSIQTSNSAFADWDDWYLYNRRNIKIGIFKTCDIQNASYPSLDISNAITTMTLQKVTQVGNFQLQQGTLRTREPDWGTYYSYQFDSNTAALWDVSDPNCLGLPTPAPSSFWRVTNVAGDFAPTYVAGETSNPNYFLTTTNINNYNYLPRSYGIGPSIGNAVDYPIPGISSFTSDIPNGYAAVPFSFDPVTSTYQVSAFYGLSYTTTPMVPSTSVIGAAPYYGPAGPFGWSRDSVTSTLQLYSTVTTFNPTTTSTLNLYWNTKVSFEALDQQYNPATDLSSFGSFTGISTELQDTLLFLYSNTVAGDDIRDVSTFLNAAPKWRWGQESASNYIAWDDQSGYNFLSYIYNTQVRSNAEGYTTHVRAYDPIPQFTTGLRFIGKNYTDFGTPTLYEIATEIASISSYTYITDGQANVFVQNPAGAVSTFSTNVVALQSSFISHNYADALKQFDSAFVGTFTFGRKPGFNGVTFSNITGYSNAITQYAGFASTTRGSLVLYQTILSTATGQLNEYVLERYGTILPSTIINRNRITDPLPFSFLFLSKTPEPYKSLPDEWGLGWNLGFKKADTLPRTTITSDTFIRITQDYIYLRLNPEFNVNTLAVSGKENLSETREPTSQDTRYFSKILLNNFGGFSRAAVQLPKIFNPVLGKYDTVSCQLVDQFGVQINNTDCDYDFVLEVTDIDQGPKDTSSLVLPQNANQLEIVRASSGTKK